MSPLPMKTGGPVPGATVKSVNRDYDACERRIDRISIIGRVVAAIRRV